jgi:hypothetical protein
LIRPNLLQAKQVTERKSQSSQRPDRQEISAGQAVSKASQHRFTPSLKFKLSQNGRWVCSNSLFGLAEKLCELQPKPSKFAAESEILDLVLCGNQLCSWPVVGQSKQGDGFGVGGFGGWKPDLPTPDDHRNLSIHGCQSI